MASYRHVGTGVKVSVSDEKVLGAEWVPEDASSGTPDASWTVADLVAYAKTNGIELGDAKKKSDVLAVIEASSGSDESTDES